MEKPAFTPLHLLVSGLLTQVQILAKLASAAWVPDSTAFSEEAVQGLPGIPNAAFPF